MSLPTNQTKINSILSFFSPAGSVGPAPVTDTIIGVSTIASAPGAAQVDAEFNYMNFGNNAASQYSIATGATGAPSPILDISTYPPGAGSTGIHLGANSVNIDNLVAINKLGTNPTTTLLGGWNIGSQNAGIAVIPTGVSTISVPNNNVNAASVIVLSQVATAPAPGFAPPLAYPTVGPIIDGTSFDISVPTLLAYNVSTMYYIVC